MTAYWYTCTNVTFALKHVSYSKMQQTIIHIFADPIQKQVWSLFYRNPCTVNNVNTWEINIEVRCSVSAIHCIASSTFEYKGKDSRTRYYGVPLVPLVVSHCRPLDYKGENGRTKYEWAKSLCENTVSRCENASSQCKFAFFVYDKCFYFHKYNTMYVQNIILLIYMLIFL